MMDSGIFVSLLLLKFNVSIHSNSKTSLGISVNLLALISNNELLLPLIFFGILASLGLLNLTKDELLRLAIGSCPLINLFVPKLSWDKLVRRVRDVGIFVSLL